MNKSTVKVSAPGKLMLFGEHAVIYGRPCIVTAVDARILVTIEKLAPHDILISAPDVGISDYKKDIKKLGKGKIPPEVKFIEFAVKNFRNMYKLSSGLKIITKSGFSSKFGFGSSSAVTVAVFKAMSELFRLKLTKKELFDLSYKSVLEAQGVGSGFDLAAAIWGGTIYFVAGGKKIIPLKARKLSLIVGYTGVKADTSTLVRGVASFYKTKRNIMEKIFDSIGIIVESARIAVSKGEFRQLGELANLNQGLLDSLGVSTKTLSDMIFAARKGGAYGAKLSGAGGGDCMIAFAGKRRRVSVERAIKNAGGIILDVKTGAKGVRIEK